MVGLLILCTLLLTAGIAFLPVEITVDTEQNRYLRIKAGALFSTWGEASERGWYLGWRVPYLGKQIKLSLPVKRTATRRGRRLTRPKNRSAKSIRQFLLPLSIVSAFRLHYLEWTLDTGDYVRNAQLFPLLNALNKSSLQLSINFQGENHLRFKASTRLYRLLVSVALHNRFYPTFKYL